MRRRCASPGTARFVMGHSATIDRYLEAVGTRYAEVS
jgi:hypothetical protein